MIYTDEQFKILAQAEPHFQSIKHEVIRNAPRWLTEQIVNVYEVATGHKIFHKDYGCAICVMNIYKQISKSYESDKKERENLKNVTQDKNVTQNMTHVETCNSSTKTNVTQNKTNVTQDKINVTSVKTSKTKNIKSKKNAKTK